ncbi:MAG: translation elongation factor Ts [Acidobacteria bacterium]|jgi:elongation factor Ts|nr:translation elongation factor Ts [Acidobacteriota bacterium]
MSISASDVKKLRDMTGAGMMDCKEALAASEGDFDAAIDFLRKKGLSKAAKKTDRETKEGLVDAKVQGRSGALVQLSCETDFVARTADFTALAAALLQQAFAEKTPSAEALLARPHAAGGGTVQEVLTATIAKLGENMQLARVAFFEAPQGAVHAYIHPGNRVGVLLEVQGDDQTLAALAPTIHDLAMQVAAVSPTFVRREEVDAATLEKEREIAREQLKESGKPAAVIEKIVDGKLGKYYEEACLLEQPFIKDDTKKVADVVKEAAAGRPFEVVRFARFALGA